MVRSSVRPIVRPFVCPNNLCSAVMLPKFPSFVRPIIWSFVHSFIVPIHHSSFVHRPYSSFVHSFVRPNNLCSAVMLPKFPSFVRPIIWSFVRSFIVSIHHSSFVHRPYSSFVRSFVQIIFVQPLCCRNSDCSFVQSFDRSSVRS
jgi:hypothetical protein